jgi:2-polyprenyl-3-methyl-5-hydroxy-6-metoxy-1,4-benzoquinol methylase
MAGIEDVVTSKIIGFIKKHECKSICDYGCGNGDLLRNIRSAVPDLSNLTGIDYLSRFSEGNTSGEKANGIEFIDKESERFQEAIPSGVDLVLSTFALHHYQYPIHELQTMCGMLKNKGYILAMDHNCKNATKAQIVKNVSSFFEELLNTAQKQYHRHHYTLKEAIDLFSGVDVDIVESAEIEYNETTEEQKDNITNGLMRNKKKMQSLAKAPEIYQDIFTDLFSLEDNLINKYRIEYSGLLYICARKRTGK